MEGPELGSRELTRRVSEAQGKDFLGQVRVQHREGWLVEEVEDCPESFLGLLRGWAVELTLTLCFVGSCTQSLFPTSTWQILQEL